MGEGPDRDHILVRLPFIPHFRQWLTGDHAILYTYTSYVCMHAGFVAIPSSRVVSGNCALTTNVDTSNISSTRLHLPHICLQAPGHPTSHPVRRLCADAVWIYLQATLNHAFIAATAWTASQRDGDDGCQSDGVKCRWDDWHIG